MCLIINCLHGKTNRMRHLKDTSWDLWQICPCCASILVEVGVIKYKTQINPAGCVKAIKKELSNDGLSVNPNPELIAKMAKKKKYPKRMSYEGVAM